MNSSDVIIVGAGPAGSTCAKQLHQAGWKVRLLDKAVFPRVKPCAGWITPQVIDALQLDIEEYGLENTLQPITGFRTGILGQRMIETSYSQPVSYGIRRVEFDDYLLKRSGVACEHETIKQIERHENGWKINGRYSAPLLIGAGGHFCPIAKFARQSGENAAQTNGKSAKPIVVYGQEVEFEVSDRQREHGRLEATKPELFFCSDLQGYGWCFRKGKHLNIGLGRSDKSDLSRHVRELCDFLRSQNKLIDQPPSKFLGHAYRLYAQRAPLLFDEGMLLVGDAAGLAYPQSGEGIRPAVESALIAADVAVQANRDFSKIALSNYAARITDRLGTARPNQVARWLPAAWLHNIASGLMATHWFNRHVVVEKWFLNRKQNAIVPTTARRRRTATF